MHVIRSYGDKKMKKYTQSILVLLVVAILMMGGHIQAGGPLEPTNAPAPTMHSLEEIYQHTQSLLPLMSPQTLSATTTVMQAGYYAATNLNEVEVDLTNINLRSGTDIYGISGDSNVVNTVSGTAIASDLLSGKTAFVAGVQVTGNVPMGTNVIGVDGNPVVPIPDGLYSSSKTATAGDTNLVTGNVKAGTVLFGVSGDGNVVDTLSGDAVAEDILTGKIAFVAGEQITGNVPAGNSVNGIDGSPVMIIPDGLYSGSRTATANDSDLLAGNIVTGTAIFGVAGAAVIATGDAVAGNVMTGRTFSTTGGLSAVGTMVNQGDRGYMPGTSDVPIAAGYYSGSGMVTGDVNLVGFHIKTNITLFGVAGSAGPVPAPVQKTGQTNSYATNDDGALQRGVTWPIPRFTVGANTNVVTDNLTGLLWTRDANISFGIYWWTNGVAACSNLVYGGYSDWRMSNVKELLSLIDFGTASFLPSGHPFNNVANGQYWTSSIYTPDPETYAWCFTFYNCQTYPLARNGAFPIWPVRGP